MTFITFENEEITETSAGFFKTTVSNIISSINDYRTERKELRKLQNHHSVDAARLGQAQRDVNRVWMG